MNVTPIANNAIEVETLTLRVLFSYGTAVALLDKITLEAAIPDESYSATTSRHISAWLKLHEVTQTRKVPKAQIVTAVMKL